MYQKQLSSYVKGAVLSTFYTINERNNYLFSIATTGRNSSPV